MSPAFSGAYDFYEVDSAPAPRTAKDAPLELRLRGHATLSKTDAIDLTLTFADTGSSRVTLLRPLDGTLEHMREPNYDLYLRDDATAKVYRYAFFGGRCGNVNSIGKDDYVDLKAGQERSDLEAKGWAAYIKDARIGKAGRYSVWVVYRYCAGPTHGVPLGEDFVRSDIHSGEHVSNAVAIVVH